MSTPVKYFWKDSKGVLQKSWGIELSDEEKHELAKKNNELIAKQMEKVNGSTPSQ